MKKVIPLIAIMATGCEIAEPVTTKQPENNNGYYVSYLFEYGGCKVYRFYDYGHYVYFTNCSGDTAAVTDSTEVKSTGGMNNKTLNFTGNNWQMDTFYYRKKPVSMPSFKTNR